MSVQCIYCQQIRAKNTSRQKQHLLECPGLQNHPNAPRPQSSNGDSIGPANGFGTPTITHTSTVPLGAPMSNGIPQNSTPMQMTNGTSMPPQGASITTPIQRQTPKPTKTPSKTTPGSNLPAPPLDDVHAAFVEFRAERGGQMLVCSMHLLQSDQSKEHLEAAPTPSRMHNISECHEGVDTGKQSASQI